MPPIRWVCVSDMHLGALNSILTAVVPTGDAVDQSTVSPVMDALCAALAALRRPGEDPPQLVVLGDLFELALSSSDDAAATFAQLVAGLAPGRTGAAVSPDIRFLAGNHDHHLWSRARGEHYVDYVAQQPHDSPLRAEHFATPLLAANEPVPVRDRFIEMLAAHADPAVPVSVTQSYPNLGITEGTGRRAVVLSHGHFVEPLYRMMSMLDLVFQSQRPGPAQAWHLEADNGGWIDFFWSSMGDSGDVGRYTRTLYESLQSKRAVEDEIASIRRAVTGAGGHRTPASWFRGLAAEVALRGAVGGVFLRERHVPEVLSEHARQGLTDYIGGAVGHQVADEIGRPDQLTFVFGHTHKPFVESLTTPAGPVVPVVNTGGWVVDSEHPEATKGAAVVLIDGEMNVAVLRCYIQGPGADAYRVQLQSGSGPGPNPLVEELAGMVDPRRDPWSALGEAIETTVAQRRQGLSERLGAEESELELSDGPARRILHAVERRLTGKGVH